MIWVDAKKASPEPMHEYLCIVYDMAITNEPMYMILVRYDGYWSDADCYDVLDNDAENFVAFWMCLPNLPEDCI